MKSNNWTFWDLKAISTCYCYNACIKYSLLHTSNVKTYLGTTEVNFLAMKKNNLTTRTDNSTVLIDLLLSKNNHRILGSGVFNVNVRDHILTYSVIKWVYVARQNELQNVDLIRLHQAIFFVGDLEDVNFHVIDEEDIKVAINKLNVRFTDIADRQFTLESRSLQLKEFQRSGLQPT